MKGKNQAEHQEARDIKALGRRACILKRRMRSAQRSNLTKLYDEAAAEYKTIVEQLEAKRNSLTSADYKTGALYRASCPVPGLHVKGDASLVHHR